MPFVFLLLLRESAKGLPIYRETTYRSTALTGILLLIGVGAFAVSGLYAASLDWSHSLVGFTLTVSFVCLLGSALTVFSSKLLCVIPMNWNAVAAILLWLLSAPFPPGMYTRLALGLQLMVTSNVLHTLHLLGIAATQHGNIIDLAKASVGVEDACSGVRSLISCIFAGVFFSATLVRRPSARFVLIAISAPLALLMNFIRSLTLTLLADSGVNISGTWHDITGFAVLGVTAAILGGFALLLEAREKAFQPVATSAVSPASKLTPASGLLAGGLLAVLGLALFFYANTRPSTRSHASVPDLAALLPAAAAGWEVSTSDDLHQFTAALQTDHLWQRTYARATLRGPEQITIYLAYWRAGQAPVSLVASHTPDACWPGSGWQPVPSKQSRETLTVGGRHLPEAESRCFVAGSLVQFVWFWHIYDGRPIDYRDPYSARELLSIAWRYGFRHAGDQLFIRVSSNRPWSNIADAPVIADIFSRLQSVGL